ncbi:hypothetical protein [uncultured Microscilla sp.]|uniref:hypothetical protein n=1 Tax=uncultured Microscilla sp. TaxID=432653 RepID=UPI00261FE4BF|nr:hypothetical protein [uncultured Microscilla sp.]
MKHIHKITQLFLLAFVTGLASMQFAWAQKIDEERMNRDIKITEKVLSTLFKTSLDDHRHHMIRGTSSIRGTYIPNYGVLFRIPQVFFNNISDGVVYLSDEGTKQVMRDRVKVINIDNYKSGEVIYWLDKQAVALAPVVVGNRVRKRKQVRGVSIDSVLNGRRAKALDLIKVFIRDYSSLLSQLSDNDKIVVTYDRVLNMNRLFRQKPELKEKNSLMVEVTYKDVKANQGKALEKKMKVSSLDIPPANKLQLEVFKKILDELFERRNTDGKSFYRSSRSSYAHLKGFGVIYDLRLRKPRRNKGHGHSYSVTSGSGTVIVNECDDDDNTKVSDKQRKEKREKARLEHQQLTEKAYAKLEKDLKKHMVDYGRTLRNVPANEMLMFNVRLRGHYYYHNDGKSAKIPRLMVLTVKMSDLNGKSAESKINVKKIFR